MRLRALPLGLVVAAAIAACSGANTERSVTAHESSLPTAVNCADAAQLRQSAVAERSQSAETSSDQKKIVASYRATFYASLGIIADLKCRVTVPEADQALKAALDAARKAEEGRGFYQKAVWWGDADFLATQAVQRFLEHLPAPAQK